MRGGPRAVVVALALASACGPPVGPDAGDSAVAPTGGEPALPAAPRIPWLEAGQPDIAPPAIPWLEAGVPPIGWGCAGGWRAVDTDGVTTCEPYPEGGPEACGDGEAHFPGEPGCRPIGRACGEGPFAAVDDLPAEALLLFVDAAAAVGGDGSPGAPYRTLAEALDQAASGATVVLAAGAYVVDRGWPDGVSLRGRCVARTRLVAPGGTERSAVVDVARHDAPIRIESVRIGPAEVVGLRVRRPGEAVGVEGVEVTLATGEPGAVVVASGAEVEARSLVARGTRDGSGPFVGVGLSVGARSRLGLTRAVLEGNGGAGIFVAEQALAEVTGLRVTRTRGHRRRGTRGVGIWVEGGRLELTRALLDENRDVGILALGAGAEVVARDLVVRDTLPQASDDFFGRGISVELEASAAIDRALVERSREHGIIATSGGRAVLRDVVVRDTGALATDGTAGRGISVEVGGRVTVERALLTRNREVGLFVVNPGSEATASDLVVRATRPREVDQTGGNGIAVQHGGSMTLARALLADNREISLGLLGDAELLAEDLVVRGGIAEQEESLLGGVFAEDGPRLVLHRAVIEGALGAGMVVRREGTEAEVEDLVVRDTAPHPFVDRSSGVLVELGGRLTLRRGLLERNALIGLNVAGIGSSADVREAVVRDQQADLSRERNGGGGFGVNVERGGRLELAEVVIEGNRHTGLGLSDEGTDATLVDAVVRDTRPQVGDSPVAVAGEFGRGIMAQSGADVALERVLIADNRELGLGVDGEGTRLEGTDLHVRDTDGQVLDDRLGLGVNVQFAARLELSRVLVERCRVSGLQVASATADVSDLTVRDTGAQLADGGWGRGVNVGRGGILTLRRALLSGNREIGFGAFGGETRAEVEGLVVERTQAPECAPGCPVTSNGVSLGVYTGAEVTIDGFSLERGATCGVQVTDDAQLDLRDGEVQGHLFGICCQSDYAIARLRRRVTYQDNGTLVECAAFPVPAVEPIPLDP
ncbi:MAG: hypothetical protein ACFCGT_00985 [Sandaracinaceae bacterium]